MAYFKSILLLRRVMLRTVIAERTNIPITLSILYDLEYNTRYAEVCKKRDRYKRRAFSETNRRIIEKPTLIPWKLIKG